MRHWLPLLIPLCFLGPARAADSQVGGRTSPDGSEEIMIDLPGGEHMKNKAGRDGLGLCVFTSIEHAGHWQNVADLAGFQQKMTRESGGGWPEKVDAMLKKHAAGVTYVQYSGGDPSLLKLALHTGRMPGVTYGYSPRYGGKIAHMVNLVHLSERWACVLDNNFPGENQYEWMAPDEFLRRWKMGGSGWAVVLLAAPPPPIPVNDGPHHAIVGQWGGGSCGPVRIAPPAVERPPSATYEWRDVPGNPRWLGLTMNGTQVGAWCRDDGRYLPLVHGSWGEPGSPPIPPPRPANCGCAAGCPCGADCTCKKTGKPCCDACRCVPAAERTVPDFGVERGRSPVLQSGESHYSINGLKVPAHEALRVLQAGGDGLTDDTAKLRLTLIGTVEECLRVLADLNGNPLLMPWKDRLLVQTYRPDAWAVRGVNLPSGGHPTIVVQGTPDARGKGRVLHVQHDYAEGAEGLVGALRQADPNYDRGRDPDLRKPRPQPEPASPAPSAAGSSTHWIALGVLGFLLFVVLVRRKPS